MKIPYGWLQDYVKTDLSPEALARAMVLTGNGVEEIVPPAENIKNVVVGRVLSIEKHENADTLFVCQIDVGAEEPVQIVTGAQNVQQGDFVPVALPDSRLPNGLHIKKSRLRGVESCGMFCSGEELLLKESEWPGAGLHGILILHEGTPGQDMREVLMRDDTVLDFEVNANRADCLSVIGIAREAAAAAEAPLSLPDPTFREAGGNIGDYVRVTVEAPDLCPRYMARVIRNVKIAQSPLWIRRRLRTAGVRPINTIVDITNFVMLETGQPMHAFDDKDIRGRHILVRRAREGESMRTLDGKLRTFTENNLLICDAVGPIGVAGIMGGENSEIKDDTRTVVFESANFTYGNIRQTSRALGLSTEASMRYAKGIDAPVAEYALNRACQLVEMLGAGEVVAGHVDLLACDLSEKSIAVSAAEVNAILGTDLPVEEMAAYLERLYIHTQVAGQEMTCAIPGYRQDIAGKSDIAEEVGRIYGYGNIPEANDAVRLMQAPGEDPDAQKDALSRYLAAVGYFECVTYSFMGMQDLDKLCLPKDHPLRRAVRIRNPLGDDTAYMRTTLLPAMLGVVGTNRKHKSGPLRLFEASRVFLPEELPLTDTLPEEKKTLILAMTEDAGDFYALKGDVQNLLRLCGVQAAEFSAGGGAYLHPGRKAEIRCAGRLLGEMGEVHPDILANFGADCRVIIAVLDMDALPGKKEQRLYAPIPRYPAIERDIAIVLPREVEAGAVLACLRENGDEYLESAALFDVYESGALGEGNKSLAYSLVFRSPLDTLKDEQIAHSMEEILSALAARFGARLRE